MNLDQILQHVIRQMAEGDSDWQMPWHGRHSPPLNAGTGRGYQGVNRLLLWSRSSKEGFASRHWATFNQWRSIHQPVGRGEKGTPLILPIIEKNARGEEVLHGFRTFHVFNGDQVLNRNETHPDLFGPEPIESPEVDAFMQETGADIRIGGEVAAWFSKEDLIRMPAPELFFPTAHSTREQNYYSTLLHELVHWTGHASRENRAGPFDDSRQNYAFEELVAELGAAFLCSEFELEDVPRKDHAQYLNSWLRFIEQKPANLWRAAALAQRAMTFLLDRAPREPEADNSVPPWFAGEPVQIDLLAPMALHTGRAGGRRS